MRVAKHSFTKRIIGTESVVRTCVRTYVTKMYCDKSVCRRGTKFGTGDRVGVLETN